MTTRRRIAAAAGAASFALCAGLLRQPPLALVRLTLLGAALGAVVESDLLERRIPNRIVVPAAFACAAAWAASGIAIFALLVALALASAFGLLLLLRYGRIAASRKLPLAPFFAAGAMIALIA